MDGGNRRRAGGRSGSLRGHIKLGTEGSCMHVRRPGQFGRIVRCVSLYAHIVPVSLNVHTQSSTHFSNGALLTS